jgi:LacI family transcriptional regulator
MLYFQPVMNIRKKTTIKDIARDLNLAVSTVSRAFSSHASCHPETRQRILNHAKSIGYTPNSVAKALVTRRTGKIAFITHTFENKIFKDLIPDLFHLADEHGYDLQLNLAPPESDLENKMISVLTSGAIDGAIAYTPHFSTPFRLIDRLIEHRVPVVLLDHTGYPQIPAICRNFKAAAEAVTAHLIRKQRKKIAFAYDVEDDPRFTGFCETAQKAGLNADSVQCHFAKPGQPIEGLTEQILTGSPDAIFAAYDKLAQRILRCLKQRQIKVPDEIALAGTGNESYADLLDPPLTSYELHHPELGELLINTLLTEIEAPGNAPECTYLNGYLVPRRSA